MAHLPSCLYPGHRHRDPTLKVFPLPPSGHLPMVMHRPPSPWCPLPFPLPSINRSHQCVVAQSRHRLASSLETAPTQAPPSIHGGLHYSELHHWSRPFLYPSSSIKGASKPQPLPALVSLTLSLVHREVPARAGAPPLDIGIYLLPHRLSIAKESTWGFESM